MPIAEAVGVREGWLQVFPPWIATRVAKAKSLMIVQRGGSVLYTMSVSPDRDKGAKLHSATVVFRSLGKGEGKTNHI